ncbi:MerR family transcriptional regulator [uncultured Helicobacter sp.]|uniref:MerR family transcriptional regulator n=1 Tax=uncultured Helicobacter sp. TaxID=175537 RepID=UPI002613A576|nr:MerR family transcriptional regulator [uncultured Helicobacter sp.]
MKKTIIEAERETGIPSTRIRFWLKKGLFPELETDKNGVRLFGDEDILKLKWIEWFRFVRMSLANIKQYMHLVSLGQKSTFQKRKKILETQRELIIKDMQATQEILSKIEEKIKFLDKQCRCNVSKK